MEAQPKRRYHFVVLRGTLFFAIPLQHEVREI